MKLWHDDVRAPPNDIDWMWAKTNKEAQEILEQQHRLGYTITECSLDHDLGAVPTGETDPKEVMYLQGHSPDGSGLDLVKWMCETDNVPKKVTIHSWNAAGARRMAETLNDAGHDCVVAAFVPPKPDHPEGCLCPPCRTHSFMKGDHV